MHFSVSLSITENHQPKNLSLIMKTMAAVQQMKLTLMQQEINTLILTVSDLQSKLNLTCECSEKRSFSETSKHKLAVQLKSAKKERDI